MKMPENELRDRLRRIADSCAAFAGAEPAAADEDQPVIYLTFDDGPGPYTARLLDLLRENGVRASFFVTAQQPEYLDLIARAAAEGHSVGAHTYTHDYETIYADDAAFFLDFLKCEDLICTQTGRYSPLFRFPGGSSNTISRRFCPGIMTRLTEAMTEMGFRYFDWNVDSGDAAGVTEPERILRNITGGCQGKKASLVLQHDIKAASVDAVRRVILWGWENGYRFLPLSLSSPQARHAVAN